MFCLFNKTIIPFPLCIISFLVKQPLYRSIVMYLGIHFSNTIHLLQSFCFIQLLSLINISSSTSNVFNGITKSYQVHIEASPLGTNVQYNNPMSKVKTTGSSGRDWSVDNDDAIMSSFLTPIYATVSIDHPKMDVQGSVEGFPGKISKSYQAILGKRVGVENNKKKKLSRTIPWRSYEKTKNYPIKMKIA